MEIIIDHATKIIRKATILSDVSYRFTSGHVYGLQGPNGCGKTMLMRLIAGLIRPTNGTVYIDGAELGKGTDFPSSLGLLIENPAFLPNYTGLDNLKLLARLRDRITIQQISQAIEDVGLEPSDRRKYRKYSLGMKQRLGIASAIMEQPDLIILDEPTNALDESGITMLENVIQDETSRGATIVMASHDMNFLHHCCSKIYTMRAGTLSL